MAEQGGPEEPRQDEFDDNDSSLGQDDDNDQNSTASLSSSIMKYRQENGRTYHAYKEGKYYLPNDEGENDRLDLQHHLFSLTFENKLYVAPIPKEQVLHRVLDVGTGTGIWAIDFADEHPESEVLGIDLSPIQPSFVPSNCSFEIDDVEEPWTYKFKFDFIHMRMMVGSIRDWPQNFQTCFDNLNPGGWIEVKDILLPVKDNDNSFPEDYALKKWGEYMIEGAKKFGTVGDSPKYYKEQLIAAGFENVIEIEYRWPQNKWPKDPKLRELGMWHRENMSEGLSGLSMAIFTRGLGWTPEETEVFLVDVRKCINNPKFHGYYSIIVVYGQKPVEKDPK